MKNAYKQGVVEAKSWLEGADQKKIPVGIGFWSHSWRQPGKKFPYQIAGKTVILLTRLLCFVVYDHRGRKYAENYGRAVAHQLLWLFRRNVQQSG
ncbi:MAG: hypothetical protein WC256_14540 [Desulfurivibrionaceae bacterium]|jgi:hypothetical protein